MNELRLAGLSVGYGSRRKPLSVISDLDLRARPGELTALLGPNGSGKSTLLRTIAGLQPALGGQILIGDRPLDRVGVRERARLQAIVLTERMATVALTAREIVGIGRHPHTGASGALTSHDKQVVAAALEAVGAADFADRDLSTLSDGQRQRVLTARALAQEPQLLLLDEPNAFLDAPGRVALTGLLRSVAQQRGLVTVMSTHEIELALRLADRLWVIDHDARVHCGTPEELSLSGLIGEVFGNSDLSFDIETAGFTLQPRGDLNIHLLGGPDPLTARLLTRLGFTQDLGRDAVASVRRSGAILEIGGDLAAGSWPLAEATRVLTELATKKPESV